MSIKFFLYSTLLHIALVFLLILSWYDAGYIKDNLWHSNNMHVSRHVTAYLFYKGARRCAIFTKKSFVATKAAGKNTADIAQQKNVAASVSASVSSVDGADDKLLLILHDLIWQNMQYPRGGAMANFMNKKTLIGFNLYPDGHIDGVEIVASSGVTVLDASAFAAVQTLPRIVMAAQLLHMCKHFIVPIVFAARG
jgi:TonB family protein